MRRLRRLEDESGSALIAGILILTIISMLATVVLEGANVQSHQTANERAGEQAFNLAESALQAEASLLQDTWPSSSAAAYPVCTQASTSSGTCPQGSISTGYSSTYAGAAFASATWSVQVIDDNVTGVADPNYYSDGILTNGSLAHWDSNADNELWIRAQATVGGRQRILVASIGRQTTVVTLPQSVITSGGVTTDNNGNKIIIEAKDPNSELTGTVNLRCSGTPGSGTCADWNDGKGQLDPDSAYQTDYTDSTGGFQTLSAATIDQLKATAQANGTYYTTTCPPYGTTGVVFVETASCSYTGSGGATWGSDSAPATLVFGSGTLEFNGNSDFYGVIYMANENGSTPTSGECTSSQQTAMFTVHGGGALHGGIFVDRCGTVDAGDKGYDISYDAKAFGGVKTYAAPSLALNTFKVLGNSGS